MNRLFTIFVLSVLLAYRPFAQQLNINVMIQPPYSNKIADYLDKGDNVLISVSNMTAQVQQFKLIPSVQGNNGVSARVRDEFQPSSPIVIGPGESRMFTFNQLKTFNGNIKQSDVVLQGISLNVFDNAGVLPEGVYSVCVKALQYNTNMQLSGQGGCGTILITSYDPPVILVPQHLTELTPVNPQLFTFQWTPSGISGQTRYTLRLVDVTAMNVFNPNDVFNNPFIVPYFEQSNIQTSMFIYDMGKPKLFQGNTYAIQVIAYDPQGKLSYKNNGKSQAHLFTIKADDELPGGPGAGGQDEGGDEDLIVEVGDDDLNPDDEPIIPLDPDDVADCMSAGACLESVPNCDGSQAPTVGSTVYIGKFKLRITQIMAGNGLGTIEVPYLNTMLEVSFQNLTVNAENRVCGISQVWVNSANQNLIPENLLKSAEGVYTDAGLNWQQVNQHIQQLNKKVSFFSMDAPAKVLPLSLDLGPSEVTILGIVFTPTAAYANIAFSAELPLDGTSQQFSLGMKGVCIRPNGFGIAEADARLTLSSDLIKNVGNSMQFVLEGGPDGSYATFNCKGVKEIRLKGSLDFSRDRLLPVNQQGEIVMAPDTYKVHFDGIVNNLNEWIAEATASHASFTAPQSNGFTMGFSELVLDFSKTKNPVGMAFPANHTLSNDPIKNNWTGILLKEPRLTLPNYLKRADNQKITVDISTVVVDGEGLWTMLDINNIIEKLEDGSLGGWGFSIDQLSLDIRKSMLQGGGLNGKVNLPITEAGLGYDASFEPGNGQQDMKISFGIVLQEDLDVDMVFAKALLANNSTFGVEIENNKVKPTATLHGSLTMGWEIDGEKKPDGENNKVSSFSLPELNFQGFKIFNNQNDIPQLNLQAMQLSNPNAQGKLSGFPVKLKGNPEFVNFNPEVGFKFGFEFSLSKNNPNGLSGATDFTIFAKYSPEKKRFVYDRTQLNCISLDVDVAVASIEGEICIYKNDVVYGDGFSGSVKAIIKGVGVEAAIALQVGNVNDFDYFYFEALAKSGVGLPVTSTMSLYGLGGGFHYNMERNNREVTNIDGYQDVVPPQDFSPGYSPSGLIYTPKKGAKGFSATVVFGLTGGEASASAFNGDLTFWMALTPSNGIEKMGMNGGGYAVQPLSSRQNAAISGDFAIEINFVTKTFDLEANLNVNVADNMVFGQASINMHASPNEWFIYIGSWEAPNPQNYEPWNDNSRNKLDVDLKIAMLKYNMYFMMGSQMPELPPLPGKILSNMKTQDGQNIQDNRTPHPEYSPNAPGFAFGAGFHKSLNLNVMIFYADIEFFAGFDVMLKNYGSQAGCETIGINGWYAKGQAYAYLGVRAGLDLNIWIWEGKFEIVDIKCSAVLYAEFTNPNYVRANIDLNAEVLNGLITVNKSVKFEAGKKMSCGGEVSPFGDLPIVSEIYPAPGDEVEVYDDIRLAFNFPKGTFEVFNEEEPEKMPRYFYYKIHSINLKKGNQPVELRSEPIYSSDGYSAKYLTKDNEFLPEESQLKLSLVVRGYEAKPGVDPMMTEEPYTINFKSKKKPDHIPSSQLLSTNPIVRQRYYLKEDGYQGHVKTLPGKNFCYLFDKAQLGDPKVFDQSKTKYLVQFTEMGSGKITEVPVTNCNSGVVNFMVPTNQLKNETMYRVRLLARMEYKPAGTTLQGNQLNLGNNWETGAKQVEITQGALKMSRYLLADNSPKTFDHNLLKTQWYFKTSKYNTLQAKLADYKLDGSTYTTVMSSLYIPRIKKVGNEYKIKNKHDGNGIPASSYELPVALVTGKEAFDAYDLYGYTVNYMGDSEFVRPNIWFHPKAFGSPNITYHDAFYTAMHNRIKLVSDIYNILKTKLVLSPNRDYNQTYLIDPIVKRVIEGVFPVNYMTAGKPDQSWAYSSKYFSGIGNLQLPAGRSVWKPHGALTQKEIDDAIAATQSQQNMNIHQMQLQIIVPPQQNQGGMGGNVNINIQGNVVPVYPLVNMTDLLAMYDYSFVINESWKALAPNARGYVHGMQEELQPKLFRDKGNYNLRWGDLDNHTKQFIYNWSRNKPQLVF
jgi:hypothetical protein